MSREPVSSRTIFLFWAPLAATWLMMAVEGPFLAAMVARLGNPIPNLAAFGVAIAVALIMESPIIMMLSASTALVDGRDSFLRLRRFAYTLNTLLTVLMLALVLTPAWGSVASGLMGLPQDVAQLSGGALVLLLPWPAAIGYRRFYQGLLIRSGAPRRVAYGTVVRLVTMAGTSLAAAGWSALPGSHVAALALSAGVTAEALASRWMSRAAVAGLAAQGSGEPLTYPRIISFYYPLVLTSTLSMAAHPVVTFFMGRAPSPLESLAVLPVITTLVFVFRSLGLAYQEVAIALLAAGTHNRAPVTRFAAVLGTSVAGALALLAFTPLAGAWFRDISGLTPELAAFSILPLRLLVLIPALTVLVSLQRAILVHGRATSAVTWATLLELTGIVVTLVVAIRVFELPGATAAAAAFMLGRLMANAYLLGPCRRVMRRAV